MRFILTLHLLAPVPQVPPCVEQLAPLLQRQEFDALRVAAASCEAETDHPRTRYYAGLAHLALGRPERAVLLLQRYLHDDAPDEPPRLRQWAEVQMQQAQSNTGIAEIRIKPAAAEGDFQVTVECLDWDEPLKLFASELDQQDGHPIVRLSPGAYTITATRAGLVPARQEFVISAAGESVSIALSLRPHPKPKTEKPTEPRFPTRAWVGAWSGVAGAAFIAGLPTLLVGRSRGIRTPSACDDSIEAIDRCRTALAAATMMRASGVGLLGAGAGVLIGGLSSLAPTTRQRRIAWTVETSLGGALLVAGAALFGTARGSFNAINNSTDPELASWGEAFRLRLYPSERNVIVGGALLGAGLGLGLSAALGLASPRFARTPSNRARLHLEPDGLLLSF